MKKQQPINNLSVTVSPGRIDTDKYTYGKYVKSKLWKVRTEIRYHQHNAAIVTADVKMLSGRTQEMTIVISDYYLNYDMLGRVYRLANRRY